MCTLGLFMISYFLKENCFDWKNFLNNGTFKSIYYTCVKSRLVELSEEEIIIFAAAFYIQVFYKKGCDFLLFQDIPVFYNENYNFSDAYELKQIVDSLVQKMFLTKRFLTDYYGVQRTYYEIDEDILLKYFPETYSGLERF